MSKIDDPHYVGKNHPPRKNRFSSTNQPRRRRRRKQRDDPTPEYSIAEELLAQLSAEVTVKADGQVIKTPLMSAVVRNIIKKAIEGKPADQLRFLEFLKRNGLLDLYEAQARFEREVRSLREEYREAESVWSERAHKCAEHADGAINVAVHSARIMLTAHSRCTCGSFQGENGDEATQFAEWLAWAEQIYAEETHEPDGTNSPTGEPKTQADVVEAMPAVKIIKKSAPAADDPDDPFYTGQLGHE